MCRLNPNQSAVLKLRKENNETLVTLQDKVNGTSGIITVAHPAFQKGRCPTTKHTRPKAVEIFSHDPSFFSFTTPSF